MGLKCWILISYFVSVIQNHRIGTSMIYVVKPFLLVSLIFFSHYGCRTIQKSNFYHKEGHEAECNFGNTTYMLLFGVVQIVLSQIPEFRNIQWLSILATAMSFTSSSIRLGLGLAKVIGMLVNSLEYYLANDSTS